MFWDLHFHSTDSDGKYHNAHIIGQIQDLDPKNQGIWAMTNHDCYSPGFVLPAQDVGINAIWATEISAHSNELDTSLHITCYTPVLSEPIRQSIDGVLVWKTEKVRRQVELLASNWLPIDVATFIPWTTERWYRPTHLSNAQIAEFLFSGERKYKTMEVLADLTGGFITSSALFLQECLKETGVYGHIGSIIVSPYEPELSELIQLTKKQDIILSVAHPNFSFHPVYKRAGVNGDLQTRWDYFHTRILPILDEIGIRNYEINSMTTPEQALAIRDIVHERSWLITYGSDNHGKSKTDAKHGLLGKQNQFLGSELGQQAIAPIRDRLMEWVS
jgi:hypothetical protein